MGGGIIVDYRHAVCEIVNLGDDIEFRVTTVKFNADFFLFNVFKFAAVYGSLYVSLHHGTVYAYLAYLYF